MYTQLRLSGASVQPRAGRRHVKCIARSTKGSPGHVVSRDDSHSKRLQLTSAGQRLWAYIRRQPSNDKDPKKIWSWIGHNDSTVPNTQAEVNANKTALPADNAKVARRSNPVPDNKTNTVSMPPTGQRPGFWQAVSPIWSWIGYKGSPLPNAKPLYLGKDSLIPKKGELHKDPHRHASRH